MRKQGGRVETAGGPARIARSASARGAIAALMMGGALLTGFAASPQAAELNGGGAIVSEGAEVQRVVVTVNKSRTFNVERPFSRAIVGSVEFADVLPLSDRKIYIQGKKVGTTNVTLFDVNAQLIGVLDLDIVLDTAALQQQIRASTDGQNIRVSSLRGQIVVGGIAGDAVSADRAMQVARSISGDRPVVNAMQVAPSQQVMLEVRFLEVTRDGGRKLGVNLFGQTPGPDGIIRGGSTGNGRPADNNPGSIPIISAAGTLVGSGTAAPFGTVLANLFNNGRGTSVDILVTALEEKGLVRRLAEPNLIALSGDQARFLAGGEFPVPVASSSTGLVPTVTIEFKRFGVELVFTPTVLRHGVINLKIAPSVSELDFTQVIQINGFLIPSLTKRDALTTVELRDGQSFAIAGLLSSQNTRNIAQVPWIGSVPVLGALFRSSAFQQKETDLVIIVTPRLVRPAVPGQKLASPMDPRLPSNDVDFFLNGQPEVKKRYEDYVSGGGELKGPYGHMIEVEQGLPGPARKK